MQEAFAKTGLIDVVIVATLLEWAALAWLWRRRRIGLPPAALRWILLPGLCLMLAVRSATMGLPWYPVALLLLASGLTHMIDIRRRWQR